MTGQQKVKEQVLPNDLRGHTRSQVFLPAKIYFNDKQSVLDCLVKNISSGGARLRISSPMGIPDQFILFVPSSNERAPCWVIWRHLSEIGVSFAQRPCVDQTPDLKIVKDRNLNET